jgi:hypothetical protein
MTIRNAIITVISCTLLFAAVGASIGYGLGALRPGYYRTVYRVGQAPWFDPVSVGIGQGVTQGAGGGAVIGVLLVAIMSWRETRLQRVSARVVSTGSQASAPMSKSVALPLLVITSSIIILGACFSLGGLVGGLLAEQGAYHRRFVEEHRALGPALANDLAFARVEICEDVGVFLVGEVATPADLERLRSVVAKSLGESRAKDVMWVSVDDRGAK